VRLPFIEPPPSAREGKPPWRDVPPAVAAALERALGAATVGAEIAWGGYSPSASFHLTLTDGRQVFIKGTHPGQTPEGRLALLREIESYQALPVLKGLAPDYLGTLEAEDWSFLILEAVAVAQKALPWTPAKLDRLARSLAAFYERARPAAENSKRHQNHRPLAGDLTDPDTGWLAIARAPEAQRGFLSLFVDPAAARLWLARSLPRLTELQSAVGELLEPDPHRSISLIHLDLRSDNLLFRPDGSPVLLDWSFATKGPVVLDIVFLAPSVEGEGGPPAGETVALFERAMGWGFPQRDQQIALAYVAGYFADGAYLPPPPGLPRLRWIQRLQLAVCLGWAADLIGLPEPPVMTGQSPGA
jgi:hypothetical protein